MQAELMLGVDQFGEVVEKFGRHLGHLAALFAQEMVVRPVRQVEDRCPRSELDAVDDGELDEPVERAVHRALVEVGVVGPYRGDDLGGGQVMARTGQHGLDHPSTRRGNAPTLSAELVEDGPHLFVRHRSIVRGPASVHIAPSCKREPFALWFPTCTSEP